MSHYGVENTFKIPAVREKSHSPAAQEARHRSFLLRGRYQAQASKGENDFFLRLNALFPGTERHVRVNHWNLDFYIPQIELYVNYNGTYWHGRDLSEEQLITSPTKQSKIILATKRRDFHRRQWFLEHGLAFEVVWEDQIEAGLKRILLWSPDVEEGDAGK